MATAHCAMGLGVVKRSRSTIRDAKKAYAQPLIDVPGRPRTWVRLPKFLWSKSWFNADGSPKHRGPVCILKKSLYGQSESEPIFGSPGFFYNPTLDAEMFVYVNDFILIAFPKHEAGIWKSLEWLIEFKDPQVPVERYLGVYPHTKSLPGSAVRMLTECTQSLFDAAKVYMAEVGVMSLPCSPSPSIDDRFDKDLAKVVQLASNAASQLIKLLYAARLCRADIGHYSVPCQAHLILVSQRGQTH